VSTLLYTSYQGTPGLGNNAQVEIRDAASGNILISRSNTGVREDRPGDYVWFGAVPDFDVYSAYWDENDGGEVPFELVGGMKQIITSSPSTSGGGNRVVSGAPGMIVEVM
jgi:hypothetical protein